MGENKESLCCIITLDPPKLCADKNILLVPCIVYL